MTQWFVSYAGDGAQTGGSWADSAPWSALASVISGAASGDEIIVEGGTTTTYPPAATPLSLTKPLVWRGRTRAGVDRIAVVKGTRSSPWPANGMWTNGGQYSAANEGEVWAQLQAGGSGTDFHFFAWRSLKYGVQSLMGAAQTATVRFYDCRGFNCSAPFLYTAVSTDGQVTVECYRCRAFGYSKGAVRLWLSTVIEDCAFDAQSQFHTPGTNLFGVHVQDIIVGASATARSAAVSNTSFRNHDAAAPANASPPPPSLYTQGDGLVVEEPAAATITDVAAYNSGDRGIDLKCQASVTRYFTRDCGFGLGAHNDAVDVTVDLSFLGTGKRKSNTTDAIASAQASGGLILRHSICEQMPSVGTSQFQVFRADANGIGTQSGAIIPTRRGHITANDCQTRRRSGCDLVDTTTVTESGRTLVVPNLSPSTPQSFQVAAMDAAGNPGTKSAAVAMTTPAAYAAGDLAAPTVPTGLVVSGVTSTTAQLDWAPSTDNLRVAGYVVELNGVTSNVASIDGLLISGLVPGTAYTVRVRAFDDTGNFSARSASVSFTTLAGSAGSAALAAPGGVKVLASGPTFAVVSCNAVSGAGGYAVYASGVLVARTYAGTRFQASYAETDTVHVIA